MTTNIREKRLVHEFQRMLSIRREGGLINFSCADLSTEEEEKFLTSSLTEDFILGKLGGFLTPEDFQNRFPDKAPEKYCVLFCCKGLQKLSEYDEPTIRDEHVMEIVFGYDYPSAPPRYVWLTNIWHPNIKPPYLCDKGRPFAVSTTLDQICLMVGQMIQYRIYNTEDPLDKDAAKWAAQNKKLFPIDTRDLLTGEEHLDPPLVSFIDGEPMELIDAEPNQSQTENMVNTNIIELI
ncbi:ubiquitin-conjugating enzyme E2 [Nostoc sp. DedQUE07]|uniref:ubiquitin-conjugating enzyme E2 n=1 Tax=Nostoc sp. DedQUE07 TaxID=3075392 RepID=UPI003919CFB4